MLKRGFYIEISVHLLLKLCRRHKLSTGCKTVIKQKEGKTAVITWKRETQVYMWAFYFSSDGKWKAYDREERTLSNRKKYNPITKQFERTEVFKHYWKLDNLLTGETVEEEFKSLAAAKSYAETH